MGYCSTFDIICFVTFDTFKQKYRDVAMQHLYTDYV